MSRDWSIYKNFRGFDIRGGPCVYINREIQGMPVYSLIFQALPLKKLNAQFFPENCVLQEFGRVADLVEVKNIVCAFLLYLGLNSEFEIPIFRWI